MQKHNFSKKWFTDIIINIAPSLPENLKKIIIHRVEDGIILFFMDENNEDITPLCKEVHIGDLSIFDIINNVLLDHILELESDVTHIYDNRIKKGAIEWVNNKYFRKMRYEFKKSSSLFDVSQRSGVPYRTLCFIENGIIRNCYSDVLIKSANFYKKPIFNFIEKKKAVENISYMIDDLVSNGVISTRDGERIFEYYSIA